VRRSDVSQRLRDKDVAQEQRRRFVVSFFEKHNFYGVENASFQHFVKFCLFLSYI